MKIETYIKNNKWKYLKEINCYFENSLSCIGNPVTFFYNKKREIIAIGSYDQIRDIRDNATIKQRTYFNKFKQ